MFISEIFLLVIGVLLLICSFALIFSERKISIYASIGFAISFMSLFMVSYNLTNERYLNLSIENCEFRIKQIRHEIPVYSEYSSYHEYLLNRIKDIEKEKAIYEKRLR